MSRMQEMQKLALRTWKFESGACDLPPKGSPKSIEILDFLLRTGARTRAVRVGVREVRVPESGTRTQKAIGRTEPGPVAPFKGLSNPHVNTGPVRVRYPFGFGC